MKNGKVCCCILTMLLCLLFAGCSRQEEEKETLEETKSGPVSLSDLEVEGKGQEAVVSADEGKDAAAEKEIEEGKKLQEVSREKETVSYEGESFMKSVFSAGGDMLFLGGTKEDGSFFYGCLEKETAQLEIVSVEMPEDMRVFSMTVDAAGNGYMLWISLDKITMNGMELDAVNFERSYITRVNPGGEVESMTDVSEVFAREQHCPSCIAVDGEGNYYLENKKEILKLYENGSLAARIACEGDVEAVGNGKSGAIYCIYRMENGEEIIGRVEEEAVVPCGAALPASNGSYSAIAAGTDTELLLFHKGAGVYACDAEGDFLEHRITGAELPVSGQDIAGYGFLSDGRLVLLSQEDGETVFHYIPAGK